MTSILVDNGRLQSIVLSLTGLGLSLRELIDEYRHQTLVLFKCCLLQPKVVESRRETFECLLTLVDAFLRFTL